MNPRADVASDFAGRSPGRRPLHTVVGAHSPAWRRLGRAVDTLKRMTLTITGNGAHQPQSSSRTSCPEFAA